jgi:transposase InsO family protein
MDFVHNQLATGQKLRVLTIVETFSRFSPALVPRLTFRGADVVEVLERVWREVGLPSAIRVDQGTEFVSRDLDLWAYQRGVTLDFSRPGKPTDNAFIEAFNGCFRVECRKALVPEPCGSSGKDGGLVQVLQRRTTTRIDRPNAADHAAESTLAQPARHREKAGKLQPPAVQTLGLTATGTDSPYERGQIGEQVSRHRANRLILTLAV